MEFGDTSGEEGSGEEGGIENDSDVEAESERKRKGDENVDNSEQKRKRIA
jgi:hypothetical protein